MKRIALISLLCLAFTPPVPKATKHRSGAVTQGDGARRLIASVVVPVSHTNVFTWAFPPGLDPATRWWNIEASANLKNWSVIVSNASGPAEVRVHRSRRLQAYRLSGRLYQ